MRSERQWRDEALEENAPDREAANDAFEARDAAAPSAIPTRGATPREVLDRLEACMRGIASGDEAAMESLYRETVHRIYAIAYTVARNREIAEEAVSDTFFQVWRNARAYDPVRGNVMAYLTTIARSRALDLLRRRDTHAVYDDAHTLSEEDAGPTPESLAEAVQQGSALREAVAQLPPLRRQLLALAFTQGLSHSEIAAHLDMPLGTVKTLIRRTLLALKKALDPPA